MRHLVRPLAQRVLNRRDAISWKFFSTQAATPLEDLIHKSIQVIVFSYLLRDRVTLLRQLVRFLLPHICLCVSPILLLGTTLQRMRLALVVTSSLAQK
jgi:hypothetical protein